MVSDEVPGQVRGAVHDAGRCRVHAQVRGDGWLRQIWVIQKPPTLTQRVVTPLTRSVRWIPSSRPLPSWTRTARRCTPGRTRSTTSRVNRRLADARRTPPSPVATGSLSRSLNGRSSVSGRRVLIWAMATSSCRQPRRRPACSRARWLTPLPSPAALDKCNVTYQKFARLHWRLSRADQAPNLYYRAPPGVLPRKPRFIPGAPFDVRQGRRRR